MNFRRNYSDKKLTMMNE